MRAWLVMLAGCSSTTTATTLARPPVEAICDELHVEEEHAIADDAEWPELLLDEHDNPVVFWSWEQRNHRAYVQDGRWRREENLFSAERNATDGTRFLRSTDPTKPTFEAVVTTTTLHRDPTGRTNPSTVFHDRLYVGPPWKFVGERVPTRETLPKYWLHERPEASQPPRIENARGVTTLITATERVVLTTDESVGGRCRDDRDRELTTTKCSSPSQRVFFPYYPILVRQRDRDVVVGFQWLERSEAVWRETPHGPGEVVRHMPTRGEGQLLVAVVRAAPRLLTLPVRFSDWPAFRFAVDRFERIHLIANDRGEKHRLRYIRLGCG